MEILINFVHQFYWQPLSSTLCKPNWMPVGNNRGQKYKREIFCDEGAIVK